MLEWFKGKKTQTTAFVQAVLLLAAAMGFKVDQVAAMQLFNDLWGWIVSGIVLFWGLLHAFREMGKEKEE